MSPMESSLQEDRAALLTRLHIERGAPKALKPAGSKRWLSTVAVIAGIAIVAWFAHRSQVRDSAAANPQTAVATAQPVPEVPAAEASLTASGYVVARRRATVSSKITGKVVDVFIEEGRRVEKHQVMARLDDSNHRAAVEQAMAQLAEAEARRSAAQTAFDDARPIYLRNERQREAGVISAQAFDTLTATYNGEKAALVVAQRAVDSARASLSIAKRNLEDTVVRAPFGGVVIEKAAQPGEIVSPVSAGGGFTRTGIGTVVDMDSLEVEVEVSENYIHRVSARQPVTVQLNAYPQWTIPGEVIAAIPAADRAKATVKVRVALEEKDPRIVPDMGARVSFLDSPAEGRRGEVETPAWPVDSQSRAAASASATASVARD